VKPNWHQNLANHGSRQLLPLAQPLGWRHPNHTYQPHPHIMSEHVYARFWHPHTKSDRLLDITYSHRSLVVSAPSAILSVHESHASLIESIHVTSIASAVRRHHRVIISSSSRHLVIVSLSSRRLVVVSLSSHCCHRHHPC